MPFSPLHSSWNDLNSQSLRGWRLHPESEQPLRACYAEVKKLVGNRPLK
jgi:hypothetical protein